MSTPNPQQTAQLIVGMSNRLMLRCRNLEQGLANTIVYAIWKEICIRTEAWRGTQNFTFVKWDKDFVITPAFNVSVRRVVKVRDRGLELIAGIGYWFHPPATVHLRSPEMTASVASTETWNFGLYPFDETVFVKYVMDPNADDPSGVDPVQFQAWDNTIFNGCMAELLLMSNAVWFDKTGRQQARHKKEYEMTIGMIRMDADRPGGQTDEPMTMRGRYPFVDAGFINGGDVATNKVV